MGRWAAQVLCRRSVIQLLELIPLIVTNAVGVGLPHSLDPSASCVPDAWICAQAQWQRALSITRVWPSLKSILLWRNITLVELKQAHIYFACRVQQILIIVRHIYAESYIFVLTIDFTERSPTHCTRQHLGKCTINLHNMTTAPVPCMDIVINDVILS